MARKFNRSQLERRYAQDIKDSGVVTYFDFVIDCYEMSSSPSETLHSWMSEMNTECKKEFLKFAIACLELTSNHNMMLVYKIIDEI